MNPKSKSEYLEEEEDEHEGKIDVGVSLRLHLTPLVGDENVAPHRHIGHAL